MKLKHDFVTNSSSSAFIVAFPRIMKTLDDVLEFVGPKWKAERVLKDCLHQNPLDLTKHSFDTDFEPATHRIEETFMKWLSDGWCDAISKLHDEIDKTCSKISRDLKEMQSDIKVDHWDCYQQAEAEVAKKNGFGNINDYKESLLSKEAKELMEKFKDRYIYYFIYSDESGDSELEHGGTFSYVPHCQISHH